MGTEKGIRTAAQAKDLDVVAQPVLRQGQHRGGEEHGFIVRVSDEQTDALVAELGEPGARDVRRVQPERRHEDGHKGRDVVLLHLLSVLRKHLEDSLPEGEADERRRLLSPDTCWRARKKNGAGSEIRGKLA